jgi:probable HAF family extracellular repeat protein
MAPFCKALQSLIFLLLAISSVQAGTWTTVDVPGATSTQIFGIDKAGNLVGAYVDPSRVQHGFLLSAGNFTTIDPPGATDTLAWGINDMGQIAGEYFTTDGIAHGFLFDGQTFTTLDFPGALQTFALGINNAGEIVGGYVDTAQQAHGLKWSNGTFITIDVPGSQNTELSDINNRGYIVGTYVAGSKERGFVLDPQGMFRYFRPLARGVNDHRIVVGINGNYGFGFSLKTNKFVRMHFPAARSTRCYGINSTGQIAGDYDDAGAVRHGFLRTK